MTQRKKYKITQVPNTACIQCKRQGILLLCTMNGILWCFPCLKEKQPDMYEQVVAWIKENDDPDGA